MPIEIPKENSIGRGRSGLAARGPVPRLLQAHACHQLSRQWLPEKWTARPQQHMDGSDRGRRIPLDADWKRRCRQQHSWQQRIAGSGGGWAGEERGSAVGAPSAGPTFRAGQIWSAKRLRWMFLRREPGQGMALMEAPPPAPAVAAPPAVGQAAPTAPEWQHGMGPLGNDATPDRPRGVRGSQAVVALK